VEWLERGERAGREDASKSEEGGEGVGEAGDVLPEESVWPAENSFEHAASADSFPSSSSGRDARDLSSPSPYMQHLLEASPVRPLFFGLDAADSPGDSHPKCTHALKVRIRQGQADREARLAAMQATLAEMSAPPPATSPVVNRQAWPYPVASVSPWRPVADPVTVRAPQ